MARFFSRICGARGAATRLGSPSSGLSAQVQGWESGLDIWAGAAGDADRFTAGITHGTRGAQGPTVLELREAPNGGPEMTVLTLWHPLTGEVLYQGPAWPGEGE